MRREAAGAYAPPRHKGAGEHDQVLPEELQLVAQARDDASVDGYPASYDNKNHGDQRA